MSQEGQAATVPEEEVEVELAEIAKACIAALTATSISKFIATPIERVKLILQTQDANPTIASGAVARYQGFGGTLARIASEQGVTSLWRGTLGSVVASLFSTHTFNRAFAGLFTSILPCFDRETQFWPFFGVSMLSGSLAGALSLLVVYPLDFARTRLCADLSPRPEFSGPLNCITTTARRGGVRCLYQGIGASFAGIVAYRCAYAGCYDLAIRAFAPSSILSRFLTAQTVVTVAGMVAYPFDTVRRRLIMQAGVKEPVYKSTVHCAVTIHKTEGFRGFYKGYGITLLSGVVGAATLVGYDVVGAIAS